MASWLNGFNLHHLITWYKQFLIETGGNENCLPLTSYFTQFANRELQIHIQCTNIMIAQVYKRGITYYFKSLTKVESNTIKLIILNHQIVLCTCDIEIQMGNRYIPRQIQVKYACLCRSSLNHQLIFCECEIRSKLKPKLHQETLFLQ